MPRRSRLPNQETVLFEDEITPEIKVEVEEEEPYVDVEDIPPPDMSIQFVHELNEEKVFEEQALEPQKPPIFKRPKLPAKKKTEEPTSSGSRKREKKVNTGGGGQLPPPIGMDAQVAGPSSSSLQVQENEYEPYTTLNTTLALTPVAVTYDLPMPAPKKRRNFTQEAADILDLEAANAANGINSINGTFGLPLQPPPVKRTSHVRRTTQTPSFTPPQRAEGPPRRLPDMILASKIEEFEVEEMANYMRNGIWHVKQTPPDYIVERMNGVPYRDYIGKVLCGSQYTASDVINWGEESIIYSGWDNNNDRVGIKLSISPENVELVKGLQCKMPKYQQRSQHILIPEISDRFGDYFLSVHQLLDVDLERIRRLYNFALMDRQILQILSQIIEGVSEIHKLGVIHADICPSNIIFKGAKLIQAGEHQILESVHVVVADFNSAITLQDRDKSQKVGIIQQASYRAPEVLLGHNCDMKVDMWSVGIIAMDLLYPSHWSLEEYDASDAVRAGEHLYRIDRSVYSVDWNMFEETISHGYEDVYWAYQDFYKKRLKLTFPNYNATDEVMRGLLKHLIQTNPKNRISSAEAAEKYPAHPAVIL